jgi:hypothetical protein
LISALKSVLEKAAIDEIMAERGFGSDIRAEQLSPEQMIALCEGVFVRLERQR